MVRSYLQRYNVLWMGHWWRMTNGNKWLSSTSSVQSSLSAPLKVFTGVHRLETVSVHHCVSWNNWVPPQTTVWLYILQDCMPLNDSVSVPSRMPYSFRPGQQTEFHQGNCNPSTDSNWIPDNCCPLRATGCNPRITVSLHDLSVAILSTVTFPECQSVIPGTTLYLGHLKPWL